MRRHQASFDIQTIKMICIIIISDRIMIFSSLKYFGKSFAHGQIIEAFQWHIKTQTDTRLNQPIGRITWLRDAFGKQVCHMYTHSAQIRESSFDMNAIYQKIILKVQTWQLLKLIINYMKSLCHTHHGCVLHWIFSCLSFSRISFRQFLQLVTHSC